MKKLLFLLLICLIFIPCLYADDDFGDPFEAPKKPFGFDDRAFEMGFHFNAFVTNNYLSIGQIFSNTMVLDLDELRRGLMFNVGLGVTPLYFNYDSKKGWGFGLSTGLDVAGVLGLSGSMLTVSHADGEKSDLSAAVFWDTQIRTNFQVQKFNVRFNPSIFYTLAYVRPNISYTFMATNQGNVFDIGYDMRVFTIFEMDDSGIVNTALTGTPGFDFTVGVEYPLSKEIGLTNLFPFLDFDVGLDLINFPIISSTLNHYMRVQGMVSLGEPFFIDENLDLAELLTNENEVSYGRGHERFARPFKMLIWANWRPLMGSRLLTVRPVLGFAHSDLYVQSFSMEAGLNATVNLFNMFIASAGINYCDRLWVNSLDLGFNLRAFQLDFGIDMRSQDFLKSWTASGLGVRLGARVGW
jgi:hypothetical protein